MFILWHAEWRKAVLYHRLFVFILVHIISFSSQGHAILIFLLLWVFSILLCFRCTSRVTCCWIFSFRGFPCRIKIRKFVSFSFKCLVNFFFSILLKRKDFFFKFTINMYSYTNTLSLPSENKWLGYLSYMFDAICFHSSVCYRFILGLFVCSMTKHRF